MKLRATLTIPILMLLLLAIIVLHGCGNDATPSTAMVQIQPDSIKEGIPGQTYDLYVMVKEPDGTPIPFSKVKISGSRAYQSTNTLSVANYEFHEGHRGVGPVIDSGSEVKTDKSGVYEFSVVVYPTIGAPPLINSGWKDSIYAFSGPATYGEATLDFP